MMSLRRASDKLQDGMARSYASLAGTIAVWPKRTIAISVFCVGILSTGWALYDDEDDPQKLFIPQQSRSIRDRNWVEDRFDDPNAMSQVFIQGSLSKESLLETFDLYERVLNISAEKGREGYDQRTCARAYFADACMKESILAYWDYDRAKLQNDEDVLATINAGGLDCCSPSSRTLDIERYATKIVYEGDRIVDAGALRFAFYLRQEYNKKTRQDPTVFRLEGKFDARTRRTRMPSFKRALPLTTRGTEDLVDAGLDYDSRFVTLAFITISIYAFLAFYKSSRASLASQATLTVGLAVAAAFGVCFAAGVQFTPISSVAAFLVLGIGLDDAFVIMGADDLSTLNRDKRRVAEGEDLVRVATERVVKAIQVAGPSITTTSVTDAAAFLAGSYTRIPAISSFCQICAACVVCDFVLQVTMFVALFALDTRQKLGQPKGPQVVPSAWWKDVYAKKLLSKPGLICVFAVTASMVAVAAVGVTRFTQHFEYEWLMARGLGANYVVRATNFQKAHFENYGAGEDATSSFALYTKRADYYEEAQSMRDLLEAYKQLDWVEASSLETNWFDAHEAWATNVTDSASYVASVKAFVEDEGAAYRDKIVFEGDEIVATQIDTVWNSEGDTERAIKNMRDSRKAIRKAAPSLSPINYATVFVWLEGLAIITAETIRSLAIACTVVVLVLIFLLGDLAVAALVSSFVCTICLCTIGAIWVYDDNINFISAFFITIAAGLATDAPAHLAHAYIHAPPTLTNGHDRAAHALQELGTPVFKGVVSTLVGVFVCVGTKTYVFQSFFKYLTTIMVLALWFGLAVAPAALAVLGPYLVAPPPDNHVAPDDSSRDDLELTTGDAP